MVDSPADRQSPRSALIFAVILLAGVALRLIALLLARHLEPHADESGYLYLAACWNHFGFYTDSGNYLWPPGYPWFLAVCLDWFGFGGVFAAKLTQVALASVVGACTMWIAVRTFGRAAGIIAGVIWCLYPPMIAFTHYLWPETTFLAVFLPAMCLFISAWRDDTGSTGATLKLLLCGLLIGLSLLIKESMLYLPVLLCPMLLWASRRRPLAALSRCAVLVLSIAAVLFPWSLRNYEVYGRWVPVAATLGENAYRGIFRRYQSFDYPAVLTVRHPGYADYVSSKLTAASPPDRAPDEDAAEARDLEPGEGELDYYVWLYGTDHWIYRWFIGRPVESEWDRAEAMNVVDQSKANVQRGIEFARKYPSYFLLGRVKRLANWISPTSFLVRHYGLVRYSGVLNAPPVRRTVVLTALLMSMLVIAGAAGGLCLAGRGDRRGIGGLGAIRATVLYSIAPALLVGMSRHRMAIEPLLIVAAAGFIAALLQRQRISGRRWLCMAGLWAVLAFLWTLSAYEVIALVEILW